ncbi:uncharacterized protein LOC130627375 [Hydractinia symbiolongicarpus]|uniref:uncharacterized protein LOC130627375 n=1 Tax=Hydractinia symbiolongicarpus TaxID=13093 RepID=UPI00254D92F5|nr:uncharacterized protein LOC130627375 [Hydractinia symbiolongicarpus]
MILLLESTINVKCKRVFCTISEEKRVNTMKTVSAMIFATLLVACNGKPSQFLPETEMNSGEKMCIAEMNACYEQNNYNKRREDYPILVEPLSPSRNCFQEYRDCLTNLEMSVLK